ncbi:MAG: carbon storage regulator [Planctomycetota bacterium]
MLVVTRRRNESVIIGEDIEITVALVDGKKVRLGISAPWWMPIKRKEICDVADRKKEVLETNQKKYVT